MGGEVGPQPAGVGAPNTGRGVAKQFPPGKRFFPKSWGPAKGGATETVPR